MQLNVHYLPHFVAESDLAGSTVIVVDLLRASTTICQALAAGAKCVIPSLEVDATFAKAEAHVQAGGNRHDLLLGGERGGQRIEGFDLGNSPADYTADQVFQRTVLFTTTNGTKALAHARLAGRVLIGAAINRQAIVATLLKALLSEAAQTEQIDILCAGTNGIVTREDILAAGAIAHELQTQAASADPTSSPPRITTNQWCDSACREWQELLTTAQALKRTPSEQFANELRETLGGKNLLALGYDDDLPRCAQLDTCNAVPELDQQSGKITLA